MPKWNKTIDIKTILHRDQENTDPAHVAQVAKDIAALLRANTSEDEQAYRLGDALDAMESIAPDDSYACEEFNEALADVYDWADVERVWLGL